MEITNLLTYTDRGQLREWLERYPKRGDRTDKNASKVIVSSVHAKVIKKIEMKDR